jgi:hypothetical protein
MNRLALTLLAGIALASPAIAAELAGPNPALTPGAVASHNLAEVCAKEPSGRYTFSPSHRTWRNKPDTLAKYGIPRSEGYLYEDDRLPLCLGGDNSSPLNHWPQPWGEARLKGQLEREICIRLCDLSPRSASTRRKLSFWEIGALPIARYSASNQPMRRDDERRKTRLQQCPHDHQDWRVARSSGLGLGQISARHTNLHPVWLSCGHLVELAPNVAHPPPNIAPPLKVEDDHY